MKITALFLMLFAPCAGAQGADPGTTPPAWSPYLAGGLIGVLSMFTFYFSQKPIGASGAYAKITGLIGKRLAPAHVAKLSYFKPSTARIDWEVTLVLGVILGAFIAAATGDEITGRWVPPMWEAHFGDAIALRLAAAFAGGLLVAFGARLAGGCTSGHGISGALQLSVGSWVALICFFVGGIAMASLLYRT